MYGMVQPVPVVAGVQSGMITPQGKNQDKKRCGAAQAAALALPPMTEGRNGKPTVTAAPARNLRRDVRLLIAPPSLSK
jgi:hypothetical protein